jgi:hypothetical protein
MDIIWKGIAGGFVTAATASRRLAPAPPGSSSRFAFFLAPAGLNDDLISRI